jgi:hypothetical protein
MNIRSINRLSARFVETVATQGKFCDGDGLWLIVRGTLAGECRKSWDTER